MDLVSLFVSFVSALAGRSVALALAAVAGAVDAAAVEVAAAAVGRCDR